MQVIIRQEPRGRVAFIVPRWTPTGGRDCQGIPFRSISVAGALLQAGWEVIWFDQDQDSDLHDRRDELRTALDGVDVAFLWMNELEPTIQVENATMIAYQLKEWRPSITVVVGGEFIMLCPDGGLELKHPIDYYLASYGEESCVDFMRARESGNYGEVSGLLWQNGVQTSNPIDIVRKLDASYLEIYRQIDLSGYVQEHGGIFGNDVDTFAVTTSRGCPKRCTFCYWSNHDISMHSADTIVDLIVYLRDKYGVRQFHLGELDFAASKKRLLRFVALMKEKASDCHWFALVSPIDMRKLSEAEWTDLAASGCRKLEFGSESGSRHALELMGKHHTPEDSMEVTRRAIKHGIVPMHNFVFGIVDETAADRSASLKLIQEMQALDQGEWISFTFRFFQPSWRTAMGKKVLAIDPDYPRNVEDLLAQRTTFGDENVHAMRWLSASDERAIKRMVNYFLPMTIGKFVYPQRRHRLLYQLLHKVARFRLRIGWFGFAMDRWLFQRLPSQSLDTTYIL